MKQILEFFKKVGSTLYDLFIASNRWMHFIVGGALMVLMCAATAVWYPYNPNPFQVLFVSTLSVLIAMCTAEFKDRSHGGKFDWKDVFAGVFPALFIDIVCMFLMLFK